MLMRTAQKIWIQDWNYSNNNRSDATSNKSSVSIRNSDKKTLLWIVELIDPTLVEEANNILTSANTDKHAAADGADMSLAKIRHFINTWNNIITLFWDYIPYSNDVEIRRFDPIAADYTVLWTVPMYQEYFQYQANDWDNEILFAFIPKNTKWREYRYDVALGSWNKDGVKKFKLSVEFVELKEIMKYICCFRKTYPNH